VILAGGLALLLIIIICNFYEWHDFIVYMDKKNTEKPIQIIKTVERKTLDELAAQAGDAVLEATIQASTEKVPEGEKS
jgi:hypothetical protein